MTSGPSYEGRQHDAELQDFDRIGFFLDIDREYASHYTFWIDQRGHSIDVYAGDRAWNTKHWVAAKDYGDRWRIEVAIPLRDLIRTDPTQTTWALGVTRIIPAFGVESWMGPTTEIPNPATFGLLRFQ